MPTVICPSCRERGRIPISFVGVKIKCRVCGTSFLVKPPGAEPTSVASIGAAMAATASPQDPVFGDLPLPPAGEPQAEEVPSVRIDAAEWAAAHAASPKEGKDREKEKTATDSKAFTIHEPAPVPPKRINTPGTASQSSPPAAPTGTPRAEPTRTLRTEDTQTSFGELPSDSITLVKEYKVLALREMWLEGRFNFTRLEEIINDYAKDGWTVKSMLAPQFMAFSGVSCEEVVVLLER